MDRGEELMTLVGRNVQRLRRMKGLLVDQMAEQAGMTPERWTTIEAGRADLTIETLATLCAALSADAEELVSAPPPHLLPKPRPPARRRAAPVRASAPRKSPPLKRKRR